MTEVLDATREIAIFDALSDPHRMAVLLLLGEKAPGCLHVKEIKAELGDVPDSKISYHLSVLQARGLIVGSRRLNFIDYSLTRDGLMTCAAVHALHEALGA